MIKRPQFNTRNLASIDEETSSPKYAYDSKVYFFDCHPEQPAWLKQLFMVRGIVRRVVFDDERQEIAYQLYLPTNRRTIYVYEKELGTNYADSQISCPWGTVESTMQDGLMVKVGEKIEPIVLLDEVVKALKLDAVDYMQHRRRIHVLLKTAKSVVRVSYDRQPEYRVFAKKASYMQATQALLM
ncbi:hypothetical protein BIT28_04685 [Photobacterium proteolyticum]|uniref:Uncharacterized protein n=1 Tax=Photobacterium proteolyticum TaxID=1903952 RepID=A0A1Q9GSF9_9GAMM|nr:hypothetical protein [Photobacterium proteolyticum]OLQ77649.1 hypothetical protein BIT28_04685 [Photobacterium proteolyticum]